MNQNRTCKKCRNQKMNGWFCETIKENEKKNTNNMVRRMKNQRWPENHKEEEKEDEQNKRG
jgi:hypothetical protein